MLYFFHHYELPHVEHYQHRNAARVPLIVGGHRLVAILHTPIRPFPHISLAVFGSSNHDENERRVDEDISDNDTDDTVADNAVSTPNSNSPTSDSPGNTRNRFYQSSDTLLRRPL